MRRRLNRETAEWARKFHTTAKENQFTERRDDSRRAAGGEQLNLIHLSYSIQHVHRQMPNFRRANAILSTNSNQDWL
jgi:hypothetical protein